MEVGREEDQGVEREKDYQIRNDGLSAFSESLRNEVGPCVFAVKLETREVQTFLEDPVGDLFENNFDAVRLNGASDVNLDAFRFHIDKSVQIEISDPFDSGVKISAALVLFPSLLQWDSLDLFLKDIALVQEQEDR